MALFVTHNIFYHARSHKMPILNSYPSSNYLRRLAYKLEDETITLPKAELAQEFRNAARVIDKLMDQCDHLIQKEMEQEEEMLLLNLENMNLRQGELSLGHPKPGKHPAN